MAERKSTRLYHLFEEAFALPLSREAQYWAGFLMADGNVFQDTLVSISIQERDGEHLKKLRAFMETTKPITSVHRNCVRFAVQSRRMAADLAVLGVVPDKSFHARAERLVAMSPDFWRGMHDGDGHVGEHDFQLCSASQTIIGQWSRFVSGHCGQPSERCDTKGRKNPIYRATLCGDRMRTMIRVLYEGAPLRMAMERKAVAAWKHYSGARQ